MDIFGSLSTRETRWLRFVPYLLCSKAIREKIVLVKTSYFDLHDMWAPNF